MKLLTPTGWADRISMRIYLGGSLMIISALTAYIIGQIFQQMTTSPVDVVVALGLIAIAYTLGYTVDLMFGVIE